VSSADGAKRGREERAQPAHTSPRRSEAARREQEKHDDKKR